MSRTALILVLAIGMCGVPAAEVPAGVGMPLSRGAVLYSGDAVAASESQPSLERVTESAGFLQNAGQLDRGDIHLYAPLGTLRVGFTPRGVLVDLQGRPASEREDAPGGGRPDSLPARQLVRGVLLRLAFDGANDVAPIGRDRLPHPTNFLLGNDPAKWRTDVPSYREGAVAPPPTPSLSL